jgi:hypothetical protein
VREEHERQYAAEQRSGKTGATKVRDGVQLGVPAMY